MSKENVFRVEEKADDKKNIVSKKSEKMVSITFKQNRKFDLHIGRNEEVFMGRVTKKIPANWLKHRDWPVVSKYFIVKGV